MNLARRETLPVRVVSREQVDNTRGGLHAGRETKKLTPANVAP